MPAQATNEPKIQPWKAMKSREEDPIPDLKKGRDDDDDEDHTAQGASVTKPMDRDTASKKLSKSKAKSDQSTN